MPRARHIQWGTTLDYSSLTSYPTRWVYDSSDLLLGLVQKRKTKLEGSNMAEKGLVMVDSRKAPKEIAEFIARLKEEGRKGKIRKAYGTWEFFSPFATMDTDYYVGYQVLLVDVGEPGATEEEP